MASNEIKPFPKSSRMRLAGNQTNETKVTDLNMDLGHPIGHVINNRYKVESELGRDDIGIVYDVLDAITGDHYAIKRLRPEYSSHPEYVEVFLSESTASMRFTNTSPRFVTTQIVDVDNDGPYMVMQLVRFPTLRKLLQKAGGHIGVETATLILTELAKALDELHSGGHVHLDLKPQSIFVDSSSEQVTLMLGDFVGTTFTGIRAHTPMIGLRATQYASPDKLEGQTNSPLHDVYAFGVIAYEMLTGEHPRYGMTLTDFVPDAQGDLVNLIDSCLVNKTGRTVRDGSQILQILSDIHRNDALAHATQAGNKPRDMTSDRAHRRQSLVSKLLFSDIQPDALIEVNGVVLHEQVEYSCDLEYGNSTTLSVKVIWDDLDLYDATVVLNAGDVRTISVPQGYCVECDVPAWCEIRDSLGQRVRFPVRGLVSNVEQDVTYSLSYKGKLFGTHKFSVSAGQSDISIPFGLGTVIFDGTPSGSQVRVNEIAVTNSYSVPVGLGQTVDVSLDVFDSHMTEYHSQTLQVRPNETITFKVPQPASALESPKRIKNVTTNYRKRDTKQPTVVAPSKASLTRKVVIGGGIAALIGLAWGVFSRNSDSPKPEDASWQTKFQHLGVYVEQLKPISVGTFKMGSTAKKFRDEMPVHEVRLSAFRMGATPVTVALWKEYCDNAGAPPPKIPKWDVLQNHPVVYVSWNDIMGTDGNGGFCAWASRVSGINLSMPTEAQFEYAARFSTNNKQYPWPGGYDDSKLWCSVKTKRSGPLPVVRDSNIFENGNGLTDMAGNVYQWCYDLYDTYESKPQENPRGSATGRDTKRCVRGGSWFNPNPADFRCSKRLWLKPDLQSPSVGFRLVANP